jgi:hypothetical protein
VVANGPGLRRHALRLRARAHRPRVAGFEDADGVRRQAVEVRDSTGVGAGGQGRLKEDVFRDALGLIEIEVAKSGDGWRDNLKGGSGRQSSGSSHCSLAQQRRKCTR